MATTTVFDRVFNEHVTVVCAVCNKPARVLRVTDGMWGLIADVECHGKRATVQVPAENIRESRNLTAKVFEDEAISASASKHIASHARHVRSARSATRNGWRNL
jgi:hypothetical protein